MRNRQPPKKQQSESDAAEQYLQHRIERVTLQAVRNKGEILNAGLDYIFGRTYQAAARQKVLERLQGLNLIKAVKLPGGGLNWIAVYPEREKKKGDQKK